MANKLERTKFEIESMLDPSVYPHTADAIQLQETHISWVVLTGLYAYKIKKPVQFDFVDYSTLEKRKHFCEQELALNRRFAPGLYLDVVGIIERNGQYRIISLVELDLDDSGDRPIEFAVRMKEFPQDAIVSRRLNHPQLTSTCIESFARNLSSFHQSAQTASPQLEHGQPGCVRHEAMDNFTSLAELADSQPAVEQRLCRLEEWTMQQFEQLRSKFKSRLEQGHIKLGHGDLHLRNIVQCDGKLLPFDGIEFNRELQWVDALNEIAFPVMDFLARGRRDLGWRLLNAYLEVSGDYADLDVLRFYLVYRAMVRVKVTWLNPLNHIDTRPSAEPWQKYLDVADEFAFNMNPELRITHGVSGSGKSTVAILSVDKTGGIRIRSDVERIRLAGRLDCEESERQERYSEQTTQQTYDYLCGLAESAIRVGFSVIVDGTFIKRRHRQTFIQLARKLSVPFEIMTCDASIPELKRRISTRGPDPSEATLEVLEQQLNSQEPLTYDEKKFARRYT